MSEPVAPLATRTVRRPDAVRFGVGLAGLAVVSAVVWLTLWAAVAPAAFGWSSVAVTSGSMEPLIGTGDIVVVAPYEGGDLGPGTVVVFDNGVGGATTHRIVAVTPSGDFVTQGDANGRVDSTPVTDDQVIGVGRMLVPEVGRPVVWIEQGEWVLLAAAVAVLTLAVWAARWAVLARYNPWASRFPSVPGERRRLATRVSPAVLVVICTLGAVVVTGSRTSSAFLDSTDNVGSSLVADILQPPSALSATATGDDVDLAWTATPDTYADGYDIYRGTTSGGPYTYLDSVAGQPSTSYTDVGALAESTPVVESVATAIQGPGSGTQVTVAVPTGTTDGDLLVAVVGIDNSEDTHPIAADVAWTELFQQRQIGGGQSALGVWYRVASSEPADYTFTWPKSEEGFGAITRYSGVDTTSPIDAWAVDGVTTDASPTAPDVTTSVDNTLVLRLMGADGNDHVEPSPLNSIHPAGTTGRWELITDTVGSGGTFGSLADEAQPTAGSTGTALFTITGSEGWIASTIALRPAPVPSHYYYVARAHHANWESVNSNEDFVVSSPASLAGVWQTGLTHTAAAGNDRVLVFAASNEEQTTSSPTLTSVTYGGQAMSLVLADGVSNGCCTARIEMWILDEAGIAAASGTAIVPTWTSAPDTPLYSHAVFENVDQGTPTAALTSASATGDTPNPIPVAPVSTAAGDLVVAAAIAGEAGTYTPQNGFTLGTTEDTTTGGTTALGTAHKAADGSDETVSMLFNPASPPFINRQVVLAVVLDGVS